MDEGTSSQMHCYASLRFRLYFPSGRQALIRSHFFTFMQGEIHAPTSWKLHTGVSIVSLPIGSVKWGVITSLVNALCCYQLAQPSRYSVVFAEIAFTHKPWL